MIHSIRLLDIKTDKKVVRKKSKSVLEHMFNNHRHCDMAWWYTLQSKQNKLTYYPPPGREYLSKKEHPRRYEQLKEQWERYTTGAVLEGIIHAMKTQRNESINHSIARFGPKFNHYSSTNTLLTRVRMAVCLSSIGPEGVYTQLLNSISYPLTNSSMHTDVIQRIHQKRDKYRIIHDTPESKII